MSSEKAPTTVPADFMPDFGSPQEPDRSAEGYVQYGSTDSRSAGLRSPDGTLLARIPLGSDDKRLHDIADNAQRLREKEGSAIDELQHQRDRKADYIQSEAEKGVEYTGQAKGIEGALDRAEKRASSTFKDAYRDYREKEGAYMKIAKAEMDADFQKRAQEEQAAREEVHKAIDDDRELATH